MSPINSSQVTWAFLGDCLTKMLTTVKSVLDVRFNEDLIMSGKLGLHSWTHHQTLRQVFKDLSILKSFSQRMYLVADLPSSNEDYFRA